MPRGCAVAYTDKGAGTDYVDTAENTSSTSAFAPTKYSGTGIAPIAIKHAHSGDNPEADWGRHVHQAGEFALQVLNQTFPDAKKFTPANSHIIAVGVSNGGGAVLRAAESKDKWLDGVVAISPNIWSAKSGGRALYDYSTDAALWMPCAMNATAFDKEFFARPAGAKPPCKQRTLRFAENTRLVEIRHCPSAGRRSPRPSASTRLDRCRIVGFDPE